MSCSSDPTPSEIARPGIGYCLRRLTALWTSDRVAERFAEWRDARGSVGKVILSAPFYGLLANLNEYRLSKRLPHADLAETLLSIGVVNIQRRGHAVESNDDVSCHPIVGALVGRGAWDELVTDTAKPEQFCHIDGRLQLVDYGNPALREFLEEPPAFVAHAPALDLLDRSHAEPAFDSRPARLPHTL
ncbi:MAG: hypothetical protein QM736_27830 [Vicinamibacterales bacterium]